MTRDELYQVRYLKSELKMWEEKLQQLRCKSLVHSIEVSDMPRGGGGTGDKTFEYISHIMDLQTEIFIFRLNIERKVEEIERYIMTLDDSLMRQIIEYRCCQCKTWADVAMLIGNTSEDSVKKIFNRAYPKSCDLSQNSH